MPRWDPLTPFPLPAAEPPGEPRGAGPDPRGRVQSPRAPPAAAQVRGAASTPPRGRRRRSRGGQANPAPRSARLRSPGSRPGHRGAGKLFPSRSLSRRRRSSLPSRPSHLRGAPAGPGWRGAAGAGGAAEAPCRRVPRLRRLRGGSGSACEEEPPAAALPPALRPPPPRAAGTGPRCHMTRRLSPCQAPWAGGVSAGRVTEGSAGGRLPPAGWRLGRGDSASKTAGHALTARRPPCLPGADGPAQTLIIPSSPGREGEGSGGRGARPPPADKPAWPAAVPRPAVRQRRAPGTRLAAHPVPSLRAHPGRPAAAKQQQHPAPGGQEGRCSLWGAAAELPPPAGAGTGSGAVWSLPAPRLGATGGEGRAEARTGGRAGGRGVGPPPPGLAVRPARLLEARAGVFCTAAVCPSRPAVPPQPRGRHRPRVRCPAGEHRARPRCGSPGSWKRPAGSGTRMDLWKRDPSQHGACRSGRASARTDRKRRPLVAVATCGLPLENYFRKVISACCLRSGESSAANTLYCA